MNSEKTRISEKIYRLTTPYKDIFTSLYLIRTPEGALLFDAASYDSDAEQYVLPWLDKIGIAEGEIKYVFISHWHTDHAGGLAGLMKHLRGACVISNVEGLDERCAEYPHRHVVDGDTVLGSLRVVSIPGHTPDSAAIFDTRTGTLVSGDCLQLYGIFGSGFWGANLPCAGRHLEAIKRLRGMEINEILPAHDYHPLGTRYEGRELVRAALDNCEAPLRDVVKLIEEHPDCADEQIADKYNCKGDLPKLAAGIVGAVRRDLYKR